MSMKNSDDTIGDRTRNLPTCSAVPQPTAPTRALQYGIDYQGVLQRRRLHFTDNSLTYLIGCDEE